MDDQRDRHTNTNKQILSTEGMEVRVRRRVQRLEVGRVAGLISWTTFCTGDTKWWTILFCILLHLRALNCGANKLKVNASGRSH